MEQDTKEKNGSKSKKVVSGLGISFGIIVILVCILKLTELTQGPITYKLGETAFEFPDNRSEYLGINKNQVIRVTKDGVTAYNHKGEEVWMDTVTLDKVVVKQKEPYFVVGNMKDRRISIFSDKGKEGDIVAEGPIVYFSINANGDVATIEETKEGHVIGAYDKNGIRIPGKRVTHIESAGFPIAVEVSLDRSVLFASYIDIYSPQITSKVVAILLDVKQEESADNLKFGIEEKDNLIYEIENINETTWVAIGDKCITYYDQEGKVKKEIPQTYLRYTPYVYSGEGETYLPIIESSIQSDNTVYGTQTLSFVNGEGNVEKQIEFDGAITYYYADEKGVIIGQGKEYQGFDEDGDLRFNIHVTPDIEHLGYMGRKLVAITKSEVISLQVVEGAKK